LGSLSCSRVSSTEPARSGPCEQTFADALAAVLKVANLHYLDCLTFENADCYNLMGIYCCLSLDEQVDIPFPCLLPRSRAFSNLIPLLVAGVAIQLPLSRSPWSPFWAIRSDTLFLGVLIALVLAKPVTRLVEPVFLRQSAAALAVFGSGVFLICVIPIITRSLAAGNLSIVRLVLHSATVDRVCRPGVRCKLRSKLLFPRDVRSDCWSMWGPVSYALLSGAQSALLRNA
jgi:hypothetical protein